jgi:hypothetical protein
MSPLNCCTNILVNWYVVLMQSRRGALLKDNQEAKVLQTNNMEITRELHVLQAHLLQYQSLLHNFEASVEFIARTNNPAMESSDFSDEQREESKELMETESENLLSEIVRLEKRRDLLSNRLKNVMNLAFATVNIDDARQTRKLTEATVRDSAAMKQVSFFPEAKVTYRILTNF